MSTYILESLSGLSTLLQYDIGGLRKQRMLEKNDELETLQRQMKDVESVQVVMSQLLISLFSIIMFIAMFILQQQGIVSVFDTIMATILMLSSFGPVMALSHLANNLLSTLSSGRRAVSYTHLDVYKRQISACSL